MGAKTLLDVYTDDQGEGRLIINEGDVIVGSRHTIKEHCHECGKTYLAVMTFPPAGNSTPS